MGVRWNTGQVEKEDTNKILFNHGSVELTFIVNHHDSRRVFHAYPCTLWTWSKEANPSKDSRLNVARSTPNEERGTENSACRFFHPSIRYRGVCLGILFWCCGSVFIIFRRRKLILLLHFQPNQLYTDTENREEVPIKSFPLDDGRHCFRDLLSVTQDAHILYKPLLDLWRRRCQRTESGVVVN